MSILVKMSPPASGPPPDGPRQQAVALPARPLVHRHGHQPPHPGLVRHRHQEHVKGFLEIILACLYISDFLWQGVKQPRPIYLEAVLP